MVGTGILDGLEHVQNLGYVQLVLRKAKGNQDDQLHEGTSSLQSTLHHILSLLGDRSGGWLALHQESFRN